MPDTVSIMHAAAGPWWLRYSIHVIKGDAGNQDEGPNTGPENVRVGRWCPFLFLSQLQAVQLARKSLHTPALIGRP